MIIYSFFFIFPMILYFAGMIKKTKTRTKMEKMMLAMGASMLVGFTIGIYFGGTFHGAFFASLVISLIVTSIIGLLIGLPHGQLGMIEGLFTGSMAGLMGAMTAEMLAIAEVRILLLLLFLLMGLGAFWSFYFWNKKDRNHENKLAAVIVHVTTFLYLSAVTFIFIYMPPFQGKKGAPGHDHTLFNSGFYTLLEELTIF